jgi:hypothetical protein
MAALWSLRGLSWRDLAKRTCRKSWEDEIFGQSARLAFYFFFAIFPALLLLIILLGKSAGAGSELRGALLDSFKQVLPPDASALIAKTIWQLNKRENVLGAGAILAGVGAAWGALNGTWAMMVGLNKAYGIGEERPWWRVLFITFGTDDFSECSGPDRARSHPLWQSRRENHRPVSWGACSVRVSLAHRTVGDYRDLATLLIRCALSLRAELKRSAVAMEYPRRGCRSHVMGCLYTAASGIPGALQLFAKDLWRTECSGHASAVALSHRGGYLYWR